MASLALFIVKPGTSGKPSTTSTNPSHMRKLGATLTAPAAADMRLPSSCLVAAVLATRCTTHVPPSTTSNGSAAAPTRSPPTHENSSPSSNTTTLGCYSRLETLMVQKALFDERCGSRARKPPWTRRLGLSRCCSTQLQSQRREMCYTKCWNGTIRTVRQGPLPGSPRSHISRVTLMTRLSYMNEQATSTNLTWLPSPPAIWEFYFSRIATTKKTL